jgi:predicted acyltransferase
MDVAAPAALPKDDPGQPRPFARLGSIDAYRGLVMLLMMAEVLRLAAVSKALPDSSFWKFLAWHQTHVPWAGCTLHDLIQPGFSFLVGVSLPFSIASRRAKGHSTWRMVLHAGWRALVLVLLGVFLRSMSKTQTNWTFEDTLSQIGLGYVPLFLLGMTRKRWHWAGLVAVLVGYWLVFALHPLPPKDFEYEAVGVPQDWPYHYQGLAAHWNKNSNAAWEFDTWLLNLFPRSAPFTHNAGGYATLSFIPTLGTMILGLIAGTRIRGDGTAWNKCGWLILAGGVCLTIGLIAHESGLCPCVKRIWTPSWVLYSGGWCFFFLAAFFGLIDGAGWTAWSFPLRVIGANSIVAYLIAHGADDFIIRTLHIHLDHFVRHIEPGGSQPNIFIPGPGWAPYEPLLAGLAALAVMWLFLYWLYRQRIFLRI